MHCYCVAEAEKAPCGRKFDAASFFGGMILAVVFAAAIAGLVTWYKKRSDARYHQF